MGTFPTAASCRSLVKPSPLYLAPRFSSSRCNDVIWKRYLKCRVHLCNSKLSAPSALSISSCSHRKLDALSAPPSEYLAATSTQFLGGGLPSLKPKLTKQRRPLEPMRAYKDDFFKFKLPVIKEKPEWWWRTLACVPYLIALQISDAGYYIQPFLEHYEHIGDMIYFIPGAIRRWPSWFFMVYCYTAYIWIVKNKELPHYFRFHVMVGMLLETALQIIWCTSNFFPLIHFNGRFGMYYWAVVGFTYICVLLECVRCALGGMYAQIPFISDAAFIHTLFHLGGFQRPLR